MDLINLELDNFNRQVYSLTYKDLPPKGRWVQPGWFGRNTKVVFIGQNPGYGSDEPDLRTTYEEHQSDYLSYVIKSPTGKLINEVITNAGYDWSEIAYTNIVKSPTPNNRPPTQDEIDFFAVYTFKQLQILGHRVKKVVLFGKVAIKAFMGENKYSMNTTRVFTLPGVVYKTGILTLFTYHPSYILRKGLEKEYTGFMSSFLKV